MESDGSSGGSGGGAGTSEGAMNFGSSPNGLSSTDSWSVNSSLIMESDELEHDSDNFDSWNNMISFFSEGQ